MKLSNSIAPIKVSTGLFAVCDPCGNIVHTTISVSAANAIDEWLEQEGVCNFISNLGRRSRGESLRCRPSWEQFEAEGYRIVPVKISPEETDADDA